MAFKVFDAYGAASRPEATLRTSGYLFLSRGIMRRAESAGATHAQLLFDEEDGQLGINLFAAKDAPVDGSAREASLEKSGISVNVVPLLRYYGFPEPKAIGKRVLPVSFNGRTIVIDLTVLANAKPSPGRGERMAQPVQEEADDDIPF
jgi:hypothetical protein